MLLKFSCKEFSRSLSKSFTKETKQESRRRIRRRKKNSITFCKYNKLELENFLLQSNDYRAFKKIRVHKNLSFLCRLYLTIVNKLIVKKKHQQQNLTQILKEKINARICVEKCILVFLLHFTLYCILGICNFN